MRRLGRGSPIKLVKAHGNTKSVNGLRKPEESKRAAGPKKKERGNRAHKVRTPADFLKSLGEEVKRQI